MNALLKTIAMFAAGAAAMYYLDPQSGRRRRVLARDKGAAAGRDVEDFARAKGRQASDRLQGAIARAQSDMDDAPVDDAVLHERIRARLGRVVEEPAGVEVQVNGGHVVLSGSASLEEMDSLARTIAGMHGVTDVENRLDDGQQAGSLDAGPATH
jgi:hypothetical protein